jgi:A/G-specific adenine glycosylase
VGRYILGAVLSQAFEAQLPIVEANSLRVLSRWHAYPGDPRQGAGQKWVWQAAAQWLPDQRIGDFNQAVMELGATVCTVTTPRCPECPLRSDCQALALNCVETIPPRPTRPAVTEVLEIAVVLRDSQQRILFARRPPEARRWANFWEVPHGPLHDGETETDAARRILSEQTGLTARIGPTEGEPIVHGVTRWKIVLHIRSASHPHGTLQVGTYTEFAWIEPHEATRYPISSSQKRLIARLTERRLF